MRRLAGLVLAAGASMRMGPDTNKLLEEVGGRALVEWPVDALLGAGAEPVFVVTGHEAQAVRDVLRGRALRFVQHAAWAEGMAGSIGCGTREIARTSPEVDGVLLTLADLPRLRSEHVRPLVEAFESADAKAICVPVHGGRRGHPVLFGAAYLSELAESRGEGGARLLLERHRESLIEVEITSDAIFADVDTPEALERARRS